MADDLTSEILVLTQRLLDAIGTRDWETYSELCHADLTCFEPEALGQIVRGLEFHKFYFDENSSSDRIANSICSPVVWSLSQDVAVIAYSRIVQVESSDKFSSKQFEETRVWKRENGKWKHVHFHRSNNAD